MADAAKALSVMWNELGAEEKKQFEDRAAEMKTKYDADMAEYKNTAGYKSFAKVQANVSGRKAKKAVGKAKAKALVANKAAKVANAKAAGKGRGKAKAKAKAADSASDSDVMGTDSGDSSSADSS